MAVVGGQVGSMFIIADDRKIDEEPEDSSSHEIPKANSNKEHDCPVMSEKAVRFLGARFPSSEFGEVISLKSQKKQWNHFHSREEGPEGQIDGRLSGP